MQVTVYTLAPMPRTTLLFLAAWPLVAVTARSRPPERDHGPAPTPPQDAASSGALAPGLWLDAERGIVALAAEVLVKEDLLEYLLVAPHGATHESLFVSAVSPTLVNAALLAAGAEPGLNARFAVGNEAGEEGEARVLAPEGPASARFLPYVCWQEDGEDYFLRVEDVVTNLASGRSMRRHPWIYLGSRLVPGDDGGPPVFLAEAEGNLINIAFFFEGNTLFTAALEACLSQTIWIGNRALLPARGTPVVLLFSRERLTQPPAGARGLRLALSERAQEARER